MNNLLHFGTVFAMFDPGKDQAKDVALSMGVLTLVAALIFFAGVAGQFNGAAKPWIKYLGVLPMVFGIIVGKNYFDFANDGFNVAARVIGGSSLTAYKIAPIFPTIIVILLIVVGIMVDRIAKRRKEEF